MGRNTPELFDTTSRFTDEHKTLPDHKQHEGVLLWHQTPTPSKHFRDKTRCIRNDTILSSDLFFHESKAKNVWCIAVRVHGQNEGSN